MASIADNDDVVRQLYDARKRADFEKAGALLADDVTWHIPGNWWFSGEYEGKASVMAYMEKAAEAMKGLVMFEARDLHSSKRHVGTVSHFAHERDGGRTEGSELVVFRLTDGKIAEAWFFPEYEESNGE